MVAGKLGVIVRFTLKPSCVFEESTELIFLLHFSLFLSLILVILVFCLRFRYASAGPLVAATLALVARPRRRVAPLDVRSVLSASRPRRHRRKRGPCCPRRCHLRRR